MRLDEGQPRTSETVLNPFAGGAPSADELSGQLDAELRRIARDHAGASPGPAAGSAKFLLHEIYEAAIREAGAEPPEAGALALCARAMRHIVVNHVRNAAKAGRSLGAPDVVPSVDRVLQSVERFNPLLARVVECRYFAALTEEQTAGTLGVDPGTVQREWARACAWLKKHLATSSETSQATLSSAWVDAVFAEALALPRERQREFLAQCSAAPAALRADVEALLRLASDAEQPIRPGDLSHEWLWTIVSGGELPVSGRMTVGHWRVRDSLPHSRAGQRFLGERSDGDAPRLGAIYLMPALEPAAKRVFEQQCLRLASLKHPSIPPVFDFGVAEDGRAFVVTALTRGRPLDRYCDEQWLTLESRCELFVRVCRAVQHAHRRLILHGAIEPSNVLVTGEGDVTLPEFGFATLPGAAASEASGQIAPPSPYATPEQIAGAPLAAASDVYQLGLLLYELLTGDSPAHAVGPGGRRSPELVRPSVAARSMSAQALSARKISRRSLVRKLRGDMDAIVLRALQHNPDRRYPSASALRSDVQRYLLNLPIWAQSDTLAYRGRKFLVRRRAALAGGAVVLAAGLAAFPYVPLPEFRSAGAPERLHQLEPTLRRMIEMPADTDASGTRAVERYFDNAVAIARSELSGEPAARGRILTSIGRSLARLGAYPRSMEVLEEALLVRRAFSGDDSLEVAETLEFLGHTERLLGRYDESDSSLRTALSIRDVRLGTAHADSIRTAVELGLLLHARGDLVQAELVLRSQAGLLRQSPHAAAAAPPGSALNARALGGLATVLRDRGALAESAVFYEQAIRTLDRSAAESNLEFAALQAELSGLFLARLELDAAENALAAALRVLRAMPQNPALLVALTHLSELRMEQGRLGEADRLVEEARQLQRDWFGVLHPTAPRIGALASKLAGRRGDLPLAASMARQALAEFDHIALPYHPLTIDLRASLADTLIALGTHQEALEIASAAMRNAERLLVNYDPRLARLRGLIATAAKAAPVQN